MQSVHRRRKYVYVFGKWASYFNLAFGSIDIMNRKARLAWELYLKMETSAESFSLLQLIANDCYKVKLT